MDTINIVTRFDAPFRINDHLDCDIVAAFRSYEDAYNFIQSSEIPHALTAIDNEQLTEPIHTHYWSEPAIGKPIDYNEDRFNGFTIIMTHVNHIVDNIYIVREHSNRKRCIDVIGEWDRTNIHYGNGIMILSKVFGTRDDACRYIKEQGGNDRKIVDLFQDENGNIVMSKEDWNGFDLISVRIA